jgi:hypothetical protein
LCFGFGVIRVPVGVKFFRLLAIGFLDRSRICAFGDPKRFVIIAFCHVVFSPQEKLKRPARFLGPVLFIQFGTLVPLFITKVFEVGIDDIIVCSRCLIRGFATVFGIL